MTGIALVTMDFGTLSSVRMLLVSVAPSPSVSYTETSAVPLTLMLLTLS